jgi:flagellar hook-associated protein 1 FlgK
MSLGQALATAMSGLRVTQASMALVSSNVANASTPGYVRKTLDQITTTAGDLGNSVRVAGVNRELDQFVQQQLRIETSGGSYADLRSSVLTQLQSIYGTPGAAGTLEDALNNLTTAAQSLSTSSDSQAARITLINAAQSMTQQLNSMSSGIQALRQQAESGINDAVTQANTAMQTIADVNVKLQGLDPSSAAAADLMDQRDQAITNLSQLMDVRVVTNGANQANVFTNSGLQLVGVEASKLSFNQQGTVTATTQWSSNPAQSQLGSITLTFPHGGTLDLVQSNSIRSGKIAAYLDLRDKTLVQAQTQLDQFAATMASALSDKTTSGVATTGAGTATGFNVDLSQLQSGNIVHLTYTDNTTNIQHQISIVRVDDPGVLPLTDTVTNDPNDKVVGIDFSGGMSSVVSQLNTALGSAHLSFSNTGSNLTALDDGTGFAKINSASATTTVSSLIGGSAQFPLFTDGSNPYTGAITAAGSQWVGLASRLQVNPAVAGDPSKLVQYSASTFSGDTTRPDFIYQQLTSSTYLYSAQAGIGTTATPFNATLSNYAQQIVSNQGDAATAAQQLASGQDVVVNTLQQKFNEKAGINIDQEMANLLTLQNAYAANAQVMSVVKSMFQSLMQAAA